MENPFINNNRSQVSLNQFLLAFMGLSELELLFQHSHLFNNKYFLGCSSELGESCRFCNAYHLVLTTDSHLPNAKCSHEK